MTDFPNGERIDPGNSAAIAVPAGKNNIRAGIRVRKPDLFFTATLSVNNHLEDKSNSIRPSCGRSRNPAPSSFANAPWVAEMA